jgi:prophage regulatory protein
LCPNWIDDETAERRFFCVQRLESKPPKGGFFVCDGEVAMQLNSTAAVVPAFERLPSVKHRTGLSRAAIYRRVAAGTFPRPVKVGERASAWLESEVTAWIMNCVASRDAKIAQLPQAAQ